MRDPRRRGGARLVAMGAAILLGAGLLSCKGEPTSPSTTILPSVNAAGTGQQAGLAKAIAAKEAHAAELMSRPDIVGAGVGLTANGRPAVLILAATTPGPGLPHSLDGVPVRVLVTGPIRAIPPAVPAAKPDAPGNGHHGGNNGGGGSTTSTTSIWPTPVPIGVSTGNANECAAGTISARVKDSSGNDYALSNNHVYAREDNGVKDRDQVLQPGLYDTQCLNAGNTDLGTLTNFVPIVFSATATNTVDAAIALTTTGKLGFATPSDGYGAPSANTVGATLGLRVQKYGRTTQLTHGQVTGVDVDVNIGYTTGTAHFIHQIIVGSNKPFLKPGDSGSLLVTDNSNNPVGLMFAADNSGKYTIANEIDRVLSALNVTIDNGQ